MCFRRFVFAYLHLHLHVKLHLRCAVVLDAIQQHKVCAIQLCAVVAVAVAVAVAVVLDAFKWSDGIDIGL